jgi:hypothetical protein
VRHDDIDRPGCVVGLTDDTEPLAQFGPQPGAHHGVIVGQHDPHRCR